MKPWILALLLLIPTPGIAAPAGVHSLTTREDPEKVYERVHDALEAAKFWVVFEADMGSRMATMADDWGADYNRSKLTFAKAMVFCNLRWTNQIANADPELLALCPIHLSIYARDGETTLVWPRLSVMAEGSPGLEMARNLDKEVSDLIRGAIAPE
jgi:uncharacterized protein (DUF302 family)